MLQKNRVYFGLRKNSLVHNTMWEVFCKGRILYTAQTHADQPISSSQVRGEWETCDEAYGWDQKSCCYQSVLKTQRIWGRLLIGKCPGYCGDWKVLFTDPRGQVAWSDPWSIRGRVHIPVSDNCEENVLISHLFFLLCFCLSVIYLTEIFEPSSPGWGAKNWEDRFSQ